MIINNKNILIFPEYHLTDFPPQIKMSQNEARDTLLLYKNFGFDILIAGYVEESEGKLYSSCLVLDDGNTYNVRKKYPYNEENEIITAWYGGNPPLELTIGKSIIFLCHDLNIEIKKHSNTNEFQNVENLFMISAMFFNFNETLQAGIAYCKKSNIKRFITVDRFNGIKKQEIRNLA